jgi:DNA-binding MarR family transcriptional regulator
MLEHDAARRVALQQTSLLHGVGNLGEFVCALRRPTVLNRPRAHRRTVERLGGRAAADVEDLLRNAEHVHAIVALIDERELPEPFTRMLLKLKVKDLGDGTTSCVVVPINHEVLKQSEPALTEKQDWTLAVLGTQPNCTAQLKDWRNKTGIPERSFQRVVESLVENGYVAKNPEKRGTYVLTQKGAATANLPPSTGHGSFPTSAAATATPPKGVAGAEGVAPRPRYASMNVESFADEEETDGEADETGANQEASA